jgi:hypothetical protein
MFVSWVAASLCQYSFSQSKLRIENCEEATLFLKTQSRKPRTDHSLLQNSDSKTKKNCSSYYCTLKPQTISGASQEIKLSKHQNHFHC